MSKGRCLSKVSLIVGLMLAAATVAQGAERTPIGQPSPGTSGAKVEPIWHKGRPNLTEGECKGLGGKVVTVPVETCDNGSGCVVVDKDGVVHPLCIDNKVN